jgi:CRISPR-associated protein Cas8a1/Csx13
MGKMKPPKPQPATSLRIGLHDPGMTPLLRAGLGGLAAAAQAIGPTPLAPHGSIRVEPHSVTLEWRTPAQAGPFLEALFGTAFAIADGLIDLPGSHADDPPLEVRVAMTDALRLTFLQHGSSADKAGTPGPRAFEIDDLPRQVLVQPYRGFVHQEQWKAIARELGKAPDKAGTLALAGSANPGAVERHVGLGCTDIAYTPAQAICACFALTGCLSYLGPNRSGVLIVPSPSDLVRFAAMRPGLAPRSLGACIVASPGDGVLAIHAALRAEALRQLADGIDGLTATTLRATAWASQQKSRTDALVAACYAPATLEAFHELMACCPPRIVATKGKKAGEPGGYWGIPSSLRGFVADNLARGRRFYAGFAQTRTRDDPPRHLYRFHSADDDLGALRYPDDLKGLIAMTATLDEAERRLVAAIHTALRQRFGAIASENEGNLAAFKNRCQGEREKWRLAFAGARTHEQVRHALADLWSRAGTIHELQGEGWHALQPLLRPDAWEAARDLALVALASYQGKGDPVELAEIDDEQTH